MFSGRSSRVCVCVCEGCRRFLSCLLLDQFALQAAAPWFQTSTEVIYIVEQAPEKGGVYTARENARERV